MTNCGKVFHLDRLSTRHKGTRAQARARDCDRERELGQERCCQPTSHGTYLSINEKRATPP